MNKWCKHCGHYIPLGDRDKYRFRGFRYCSFRCRSVCKAQTEDYEEQPDLFDCWPP